MTVRAVLTLAVAVTITTTACVGPAPPPAPSTPAGPTLPPRPREIRLDGLDPCAALTPAQLTQLDIAQPGPTSSDNGPACQWDHAFSEPFEGYRVGYNLHQDAAEALRVDGTHAVIVAGFPTVQTFSPYAPDPAKHCILVVDVAAGQNIEVLYRYRSDQIPMTRELACRKAATAAELVLQTLQAR